MAEVNIPGVTDKYKTNDLVKSLMEVEKQPLYREQDKLESYKEEQANWRRVNQQMSSLRETSKSLYSFENPFNERDASSSDESVLTASANRDADFSEFKVKVDSIATSDRFLSKELDKNMKVPEGKYIFSVSDKSVILNWKGGKLTDFVTAINKRSNNTVKASLINVSGKTQSLLIESLKTGSDNRLVFEKEALDFALDIDMIKKASKNSTAFCTSSQDLGGVKDEDSSRISLIDGKVKVPPQNAVEIKLSDEIKKKSNTVEFSLNIKEATEEDLQITENTVNLDLPDTGFVSFKGITITSFGSDANIIENTDLHSSSSDDLKGAYVYMHTPTTDILVEDFDELLEDKLISLNLTDYPNATGIIIKNKSEDKTVNVSEFQASDSKDGLGYEPVNPVSIADDAHIKYEGIDIVRPSNKIDDLVPNVTLNLKNESDDDVTVTIKPNEEAAKDAIITFVGKYNGLMTELNILTQTNPEVISEIEYFTEEEKESAGKRLGTMSADFTLKNEKSSLQQAVSNPYPNIEDSDITMLSQIGISTNASGSGGYNASKMRGYLEIDEKKLDQALAEKMDLIKNLFGYDTDGDLVIDNGVGYTLDKNLQAYVQTSGIIATRTSGIDTKIKNSESQIKKLESQLEKKEIELKSKYSQMEGTLNSLEGQSNSISNFNKQNSNR